MEARVREDILAVLDRVISIVMAKEERDIIQLKELSNHTIHNASIFQDEDSVTLAVVVYSLSKILERGGELGPRVKGGLGMAKEELESNSPEEYKKTMRGLLEEISRADGRLGLFIEEVVKQAAIKKGGKLYEHGISLAQAAEVLNISHWELMSYVGKTKITDLAVYGKNIKARLGFARSLFGVR